MISERRLLLCVLALPVSVCLALPGCSSGDGDYREVQPADIPVADPHAKAHDHPSEGPHHGVLIELGDDEFHAEIVLPDDSEQAAVIVYVLDKTATQAVAIESEDVAINLSHDGKPEQFKLAARRADADPEGRSSQFASSDAELVGHFREDAIHGQLVLMINGTSYRGEIDHHAHGGSHAH